MNPWREVGLRLGTLSQSNIGLWPVVRLLSLQPMVHSGDACGARPAAVPMSGAYALVSCTSVTSLHQAMVGAFTLASSTSITLFRPAMRWLMRHSSPVHKHSPQKHVTSMHPCNSKWLLFVINTKGCSVTAATGGRCCMVLGYWRIGHMSAWPHGRPPTGFSQEEMGLNGEPSAGMHARGPFGAYDTSTSVEARDEEKEPTASSIYEFQPDGIMKWRSERWKCQRCRPSAIITHGVRIS